MSAKTDRTRPGQFIPGHNVVSRDEWLTARKELLVEEKRLTRERDAFNERRRALPWVKVEKDYVFEGPAGRETLSDLFGPHSQLIVQHFMFGPDWEEGCVGCSFTADHVDAANQHLMHHDVSLVVVSRAPLERLSRFQDRMGWKFKWVSSLGSDFNFDFHASFTPEMIKSGTAYENYAPKTDDMEETGGHSIFYKDATGAVYHTYSCYARGDEQLIGAYNYLDMTPKGRNETGPEFNLSDWVRHHDRYGAGGSVDPTGRYHAADKKNGCECEGKKGNV